MTLDDIVDEIEKEKKKQLEGPTDTGEPEHTTCPVCGEEGVIPDYEDLFSRYVECDNDSCENDTFIHSELQFYRKVDNDSFLNEFI